MQIETSPLPALDPTIDYPQAVLNKYPVVERNRYYSAHDSDLRRKNAEVAAVTMEVDPSERVFGPTPLPEMRPTQVQLYNRPIGPALPASIIATREAKRNELLTGRERVHLAGDKQSLIVGYKNNSLCNTLVGDALDRAYMAIQLLDKKHADIILARLAKAGVKNSNASHAGSKEVSFKKAVSIALQAERWVYQAQAAAAKSMAKQSKTCLHNLAGKRKRTAEEKAAAYEKRFGRPRGDRTQRATAKLQKRIANLGQ